MAVINNELDMFNHLLTAERQQAVEVEPAMDFRKGLQALDSVLFRVKKNTHFGGRFIVFEYMMNKVGVLAEDAGDGNLRLSYEVLEDFDAKFR